MLNEHQSEENTTRGVVLIADDNPTNVKILHTLLMDEGYYVRVAMNGQQAYNSVQAEKPDLLLLDIHMPEMDGYETCKLIKSDDNLKDVPIIFISALNEDFNRAEAFDMGIADFINKPFAIEEVLSRVSTHVELSLCRKEIKRLRTELEATT